MAHGVGPSRTLGYASNASVGGDVASHDPAERVVFGEE